MAENERAGNKNLGDRLGRLRYKAELTQQKVADLLGVKEATIRNWESGRYTPAAKNLQNLIKFYLAHGNFTQGHEEAEAEELWELAYQDGSFDPVWFANCLEPSAPAETVAPSAPEVSQDTYTPHGAGAAAQELIAQITARPMPEQPALLNINEIIQNLIAPFQSLGTASAKNHDRQRMLEKLHLIWIEGILQNLLHGMKPIQLDFRADPAAVAPPWDVAMAQVPSIQIPSSTSEIIQIYDSAQGELLILGEAGAGKTTLMLGLMRVLLERARQDPSHPIPVVFNLSSWGVRSLPMKEWLVEDLKAIYHVPAKTAQEWVDNNQIALLLDGLDEVKPEQRAACIQAINKLKLENGLVPLVVCCRHAEYKDLFIKLRSYGAVMVQPLSRQQIEDYIKDMHGRRDLINSVLQSNPAFQQLISTPLMLDMFMQAYDEETVQKLLAKNTPEKLQELLFAAYVQHRLEYRGKPPYSLQQIETWLGWLARELEGRNLSDLYIERMQFDWLPKSRLRALYPGFVVGLMYGIIFGVIKGLNYAFMRGADQYHRPFTVPRGILDGIAIGLFNLCIFMAINGMITWFWQQREEKAATTSQPVDGKKSPFQALGVIAYGIPFGVLNAILITVLVDLPAGLDNGLFIWLIYVGLGRLNPEIQPAERFSWSRDVLRQKLPRLILYGLLVGAGYGVITALYWQITKFPAIIGLNIFLPCLLFGLSIGVVIGLLIGVAQALSHAQIENKDLRKPNQGIWHSFWNSVQLGLISCVLAGLFIGVIYGIVLQHMFQAFGIGLGEYGRYFPKNGGLVLGIVDGLAVGAFFWIRRGGTACVQHVFLRLLLWRAQCMPWHYPAFLDAMAEKRLLHKVGGGYTFAHDLLRKYFAGLNKRGEEQ